MKCPACDKPLRETTGTGTVKIGRRQVPYDFKYLVCGTPGHAWVSDKQRLQIEITVSGIREAEQKLKQAAQQKRLAAKNENQS